MKYRHVVKLGREPFSIERVEFVLFAILAKETRRSAVDALVVLLATAGVFFFRKHPKGANIGKPILFGAEMTGRGANLGGAASAATIGTLEPRTPSTGNVRAIRKLVWIGDRLGTDGTQKAVVVLMELEKIVANGGLDGTLIQLEGFAGRHECLKRTKVIVKKGHDRQLQVRRESCQ